MSEISLRGWNVAVPVVDVGDDVFLIDDTDKTTFRLQVKAAEAQQLDASSPSGFHAVFQVSRSQLRTEQAIELFYMLLLRLPERWRFVLVSRAKLHENFLKWRRSPNEAGSRSRITPRRSTASTYR